MNPDARHGIALAGNWILDRVKTVDVYPAQDALANIRAVAECNGGAPYNVAADLVRLKAGFPLFALGRVGNDDAGRAIRRDLESSGVDAARLATDPDLGTSFTDVMTVAGTGRRTFFHYRGANASFDGGEVDFDTLPARHLHLGYLLLLDAMDRADGEFGTVAGRFLARARRAGLTTSVDLVSEDSDRFAPLVLPTLRHADALFANEFEIARTTRRPLGASPTDAEVLAAARDLFDAGFAGTLYLHTPEVTFAASPDGALARQGSVRVPPEAIRGTVGAGDAFAAGVLLARHEGRPTADALKLGVNAAAACVTDPTTSLGLRPAAACLALGDRWGYRS